MRSLCLWTRVGVVFIAAILAVTLPALAKLEPPVDIALAADETQVRAGAVVDISGTFTPRIDLGILDLRFESEGGVMVRSADKTRFYNLAAGQPVPFTVTVRYLRNGKAAVHVWADGADRDGRVIWSKRETLYALVRADRSFAAMGDYLKLDRAAIAWDRATNRISAEAAAERLRALSRVPFARDNKPLPEMTFNAEQQRFNAIIGAPENGYQPRAVAKSDGVHKMDCCITVQGHVDWTDENGNTHPVYGAAVHIRDDDLGPDEDIVAVPTDVNGNYFVQVDNDDGIGAGDRDIYVEVHAANSLINTTDGSDTYMMVGPVHDETPTGTVITENFTAANSGGGEAFSVFQAGTWIAVYTRDKNGGPLPQIEVFWPNGGTSSFYDGSKLNIEQPDRWDWDTVMHEYGHYIADQLNTEDNPGGPHNLGDCISVTGSHDKSEGVRLAWGEGWPTYNGTVAQQIYNLSSLNVPRVGDTSYQDLEDGSVVYNLEGEDSVGIGEDNEVAVQRLLFDLWDSANDNRDAINRSDQSIWNTLDGADPTTLSAGWNALRAGVSNQTDLLMGRIASDQTIGPRLIAPVNATIVTPSNANFSWRADVGCSNSFAGNSFTLKFYNAATFANVLNVPGLSSTSTTLTAGQLATLIASSHQILWAVEGSNTSSPATGPYLGENFAITVNRPPTANAGSDITAECSSYTTTPVTLSGSASDPDGDTLTFTWSAPGVTFDNNHSATPTGQFPEGTTTVTLTVSDGIQQASDTMTVSVVDTTAPAITCPANITVECTGNLGVQASDPQLVPFFGGVSAIDICDPNPVITNNAPAFFPLGATPVTFTATDADGNASSCTATVTVVDTHPPEISMTVSPTSLWPPNHKMVQIEATVTVTDECDPNPTFTLTSITSNEPDNGLGDGDTPNDIQGAAYGTADTSFQLRAERSGKGTGRIYTITYTGQDSSGNTAIATATVVVRHP